MSNHKPAAWRGSLLHHGNSNVYTVCRDHPNCRCTVIEDGAVMPLDESTQRLVEAVLEWKEEYIGMEGMMYSWDKKLIDALAAFDASRGGKETT